MFQGIQSQVYIGNELIPIFKSLVLSQEIDAHHDFKMICRKDTLESTSHEIFGESKNFLGEKFIIILNENKESSNKKTLRFKGIVTAINSSRGLYYGDGDLIEVKGKSTSIISDDGPHLSSFMDNSLNEIIEKTFKGYDKSLLEVKITPENKDLIHYSVQQNESAFRYVSRLAAQYGEWFYYDGTKLKFGEPPKRDIIKLDYGSDLMTLSVNLEPISNNFKYITNDYFTDSFHETKTKEITSNLNGEHALLRKKAQTIYPKETQIFVNAFDDSKMKPRMDEQIRKQKLAREASQIKITGKSYNSGVQIGSIIEVDGKESHYGNYRITKVIHNISNGNYENSFEAIPENVKVYPKTSVSSFPKSKSQTAVIINNNDPDGLGRVQVQYPWQKPLGETTPFIRLSSTAAGAGQGFFMVPEIGDEVIVGYEGGNAESPIVQGSLYNASSVPESFKSGNNHLKAIKTRSGNQVTLNDANGSVTIADPSGNTIVMGGNGEITINAPKKITFSSKDIAIEASNDFSLNAGNNINNKAATDISSSAGAKISIDAGSDLNAKAGAKATFKGAKSVTVFGKRVSITGLIMMNIQSGAILTVMTMGVLNLTGAAKNLLNGAKVTILGKRVEINN